MASLVKENSISKLDERLKNLQTEIFTNLKETKSKHYEFWNSLNFKKKQFYERALKYAYRPFGPNMTLNHRADEIDPRTYFAIRGFLDELKHNATQNNIEPELILPTTWILTFDERVTKI